MITEQMFKESFKRSFSPNERRNEVIIIVYRLIVAAIIGYKYDRLILTPTHLA